LLTQREDRKLRVFENRVLRRIYGPKRDEVIGECIKLHNEELNYLYFSPNIRVIKSRRLRMARHVTSMVEGRGAYRILVGKSEGRPRRRWENNIKMDLQEVEIDLAQNTDRWLALVNEVINLRVP
jgi:hypothetical protein